MAISEASLHIALGIEGIVPNPDIWPAIARAQKKNAEIAEATVKERAFQTMSGSTDISDSPSDRYETRDPRDQGKYPGSMVQYYSGSVNADLDVVLDNPTARADYFEYGTVPHEITPSGPVAPGTVARGRRGQFARGARALKFNMGEHNLPGKDYGFRGRVWHPGQRETLVMYETMGDLIDVFAENIADEIAEEFANG